MTTQPETIKSILQSTRRLLKHQKEMIVLRGENFNLFSILGMESRENETHSAFIGELLDPKGSHLQGAVFLKMFLKEVSFNAEFDVETAHLILEKHVGSRNDENKSGGRIDIYLRDDNGNSISIENKIYAGDQYAQIERYVNHNREKNTVYYLTLHGNEASKGSSGELNAGEHYYTISYESNIIDWLQTCMKEAAGQPILRESIKQYIILLKKLTNQLADRNMEHEIINLIKNNYQEAKVIEANLRKVEISMAREFLIELKELLLIELGNDDWTIEVSESLENSYEGFWLRNKFWIDNIAIKIEGQSKIPYDNAILGFIAPKNKIDRERLKQLLSPLDPYSLGYVKETNAWPYYEYVLSWRNEEKRAELFDSKKREKVLKDLFERIVVLARGAEELLKIDKLKL